MFAVYQIINKLNGKSYVGFTTRSVELRWNEHQKVARTGIQWALPCAIRKYGSGGFVVEILEEGWDPKIGKDSREPYWISVLKPEYNMTDGGDGIVGYKHSIETRQKQSSKAVGRKHSQATLQKIGRASSVRHPTPETRRKQSAALMGIIRGPQSLITCPHCGKIGGNAMRTYHFGKCKSLLTNY